MVHTSRRSTVTWPHSPNRNPESSCSVTAHHDATDEVLSLAAYIASVNVTGSELIHNGSHAMYKLPRRIVARVGRPGTGDVARREVEVSQWLARSGLPVVEALPDVPQPVVVNDRPVTWWRSLSAPRPATPAELGRALRCLHAMPVPEIPRLPVVDPFAEIDEQISHAENIDVREKEWLLRHVASLRNACRRLSRRTAHRVIHGDARQCNVVVPRGGVPALLDLEHVAIGCPDWDLVPLAVGFRDFARIRQVDYEAFVHAYGGYDVMDTCHFRVMADIQELRWACFAIGKGLTSGAARKKAQNRIACLRGEIRRPWKWTIW